MPVYIRTAAGNEAALDQKSTLPRKLRTLLISIDGRTRLNVYVNSLSSFGDVEALIQSLLQAGLIQTQASLQRVSGTSTNSPDSNDFDRSPAASWKATDGASTPWQGTQIGEQAQINDSPSWAKFQPPVVVPSASVVSQSVRSAPNTAHYQLRTAIGLMSDFATQHLPMESLELVLTIEGLASVEHVLASLQGYESMIAHLGEPARKHLAELRGMLSAT
jgi:hypothetical protein